MSYFSKFHQGLDSSHTGISSKSMQSFKLVQNRNSLCILGTEVTHQLDHSTKALQVTVSEIHRGAWLLSCTDQASFPRMMGAHVSQSVNLVSQHCLRFQPSRRPHATLSVLSHRGFRKQGDIWSHWESGETLHSIFGILPC